MDSSLGLQCPSRSILNGMAVIMILTGGATFTTLIWGRLPAGYGRYVHHVGSIDATIWLMLSVTPFSASCFGRRYAAGGTKLALSPKVAWLVRESVAAW